jgi:hypothetical protein
MDSWEYLNTFERCLTRGVPGASLPTGVMYNTGMLITQTPQQVVFHYEMFDTRVIAVDGRPHLGSGLRQWTGDSKGHWEGDTLVVDVTNFNGKGRPMAALLGSDALHVTERLKRIDENTLDYEATIDDVKVFTKPWTVGVRMVRSPSYKMFEYACHEGNKGIFNMLSGARAQEQEKKGSKKSL